MDDRYKQVNPKFRGGVSSSRSIRAAQQVKDRKLQRFNSLQTRRNISESDVLSPATPYQQNENRPKEPTERKSKKEAEDEERRKLMQRLENYKKKKQRLQLVKKLKKKPIFYSGGGGISRNPLVEPLASSNIANTVAKSPSASTSKRQAPVWHSGFSSMSKKNNFTRSKENKPMKSNKNLFSTVQYRSRLDLCKPTEFKQTLMPSQDEFRAPFGLKEITPIGDSSRRSTIRFSSPPPRSVSSPDDKPKKMPLVKTPRPSSGRTSKKSAHRVASNDSNSISSSESFAGGECEIDPSKVTPERNEDREHFLKQMEQSVGRSSSKMRTKLSCSRLFSPGASLREPGSPTSTRGGDSSTTSQLNCLSSPNVSRTNLSVKFVSPDTVDNFNISRKSSSFTKRKSTPHPIKSKSALPSMENDDNSADEAVPVLRLSESPASEEKNRSLLKRESLSKRESLTKRESVSKRESGSMFTVIDKSPFVESAKKESSRKSSTPSQQFNSSTTGSKRKSLNDSKRSRKSINASLDSSYIQSTLEPNESFTKPTETVFSVKKSDRRVSLNKSTEKKPADAVFSVSLNESDSKSTDSFSQTITAEDIAIMTPISTKKRKARMQDLASSVPRRSARLSSIYDCSTPCSQRAEPVTPCSRTTQRSHAAHADLTWLTENTPISKRKRKRKDTIGNVADSFAEQPQTPKVVLTPATETQSVVQENQNHISLRSNTCVDGSSPESVENISNHQKKKKIKPPKWLKVMARSLRDSSFVTVGEELPESQSFIALTDVSGYNKPNKSPSSLALSVPRVNKSKRKTLKRRSSVRNQSSDVEDGNMDSGTTTHQSTMQRVRNLLGKLETHNKTSNTDSSGKKSKRKKKRLVKVDLEDEPVLNMSLNDGEDETEGAGDQRENADHQAENSNDQAEKADNQTDGVDQQTRVDDQADQFSDCTKALHTTEGVQSSPVKGTLGLPDELLRPSALTFETTCTPDGSVFSGDLSEANTPQSRKKKRVPKMSRRVSQLASLYEEEMTPSSGKKRRGRPSSVRKSIRLKKVIED